MNKTITTILKTNIQGQINEADVGGGICIAGAPGIGKTASMKLIAKEMNMQFLHVSIPEVTVELLGGIPDFKAAPHMDKYSTSGAIESLKTQWSVPELVESANLMANEEGYDGCILMIDDLHRVSMSVAPTLYGMLGERKLGAYKLDPKVAIMGAMNDSDEAGFSGIDSPIKDRLGILPVPFDFDYWFQNFGRGLHFYISSFLKAHPTYAQEDESTMIEQFGTPRSWTHLANEFELYELEFIQENAVILAKQKVSKSAANELAKHIAYIEAIDFTDKIAAKKDINIKDLKAIDQILYAYIINYVDTVEDAEYVMKLIDSNIDSDNFIGFIVGELYTKFLMKEKGKSLSKGLIVLLEKLLDTPKSEIKSTLSKKDKEIYEKMQFKEHTKLIALATEFTL